MHEVSCCSFSNAYEFSELTFFTIDWLLLFMWLGPLGRSRRSETFTSSVNTCFALVCYVFISALRFFPSPIGRTVVKIMFIFPIFVCLSFCAVAQYSNPLHLNSRYFTIGSRSVPKTFAFAFQLIIFLTISLSRPVNVWLRKHTISTVNLIIDTLIILIFARIAHSFDRTFGIKIIWRLCEHNHIFV